MVALVQVEFWEDSLAKACAWHIFVLIPKGIGKDFRGIRLVEVLRKSTICIINWRLTIEITYHDRLHGFRTRLETETTILKDKLLHKMKFMR